MSRACSACDQARASAIWPIAGGGLTVLQLQRALRQAGDRAPERDRAGGDDQHVGAALMQRRDVGDQRVEPILLQRAARAVDQQRRADLDDDAV